MNQKSKQLLKKIIIIIVIVAAIMILIASCGNILLQLGITTFDYKVNTDKSTITITGMGTVKGFSIVIPEIIDGYTVTAIGDYAFKDNDKLLSIHIPSTVEYIGQGAFYNCTHLTRVYDLENCKNLNSIQNQTFYNCKYLQRIDLPDGIVSIGEFAFKSCHQLSDLQIPQTVKHIGKRAFDNCQSIEEIVVPSGVETIEEGTFFSCHKLKTATLPEGLTSIGEEAFTNCYELSTIKMPSTIKDIGDGAFKSCKSLNSLDVPNGVLAINCEIFVQCVSLSHISIPASIEYIDPDAFDFCENLQDISIDKNNPMYRFYNGAIYNTKSNQVVRYLMGKTGETFTISDNIISIGYIAFGGNPHLKTLNIPNSVKWIDEYAFYSSVIDIINYDGTIKEWGTIEKHPQWNANSSEYTIYCTDGQIAKDGTVTYN